METRAIDPTSTREFGVGVPTFPQAAFNEADFDYQVTLDGLLNNNSPLAGRALALRTAAELCGLEEIPSADDVSLTQGYALYFGRDYYVACPTPGKEIQ